MNKQQATELINASLHEGAELRTVLARDCSTAIFEAASLITMCLRAGGKLLFFGNGGSAADAQHLAAEFVGRFVRERAGLPAIALTTDSSILTAVGNDYGFEQIFARQVQALGRPGDVAIAISTSGNSPNIIEGVKAARKGYLKTIGLSGKDGGLLAKEADLAITIASRSTARIQECHIAVGHLLCELTERDLEGGLREGEERGELRHLTSKNDEFYCPGHRWDDLDPAFGTNIFAKAKGLGRPSGASVSLGFVAMGEIRLINRSIHVGRDDGSKRLSFLSAYSAGGYRHTSS